MLGANGGWEGLAGTPICLFDKYYANGKLVNQYRIEPVLIDSVAAAADAIAAGNCSAFGFDTGEARAAWRGRATAAHAAACCRRRRRRRRRRLDAAVTRRASLLPPPPRRPPRGGKGGHPPGGLGARGAVHAT